MTDLFLQPTLEVVRSFYETRLVTARETRVVDHTDPERVEPRLRAPYFTFEVYAATEVKTKDGATRTLYSSKPLWTSYFIYQWPHNGHTELHDPDLLIALLDREGKTVCAHIGPPVGAWIKYVYEWAHPTLSLRRKIPSGEIAWTEVPVDDSPFKGKEATSHGFWDILIPPVDEKEDLKIRFPKGCAGGEDQAPRYVMEKDLPLQSRMTVWPSGIQLWICRGNQKWIEVIFAPHHQIPRFEIIVWEQIPLPPEVPEEQRA